MHTLVLYHHVLLKMKHYTHYILQVLWKSSSFLTFLRIGSLFTYNLSHYICCDSGHDSSHIKFQMSICIQEIKPCDRQTNNGSLICFHLLLFVYEILKMSKHYLKKMNIINSLIIAIIKLPEHCLDIRRSRNHCRLLYK